jgi:hypothetical protein
MPLVELVPVDDRLLLGEEADVELEPVELAELVLLEGVADEVAVVELDMELEADEEDTVEEDELAVELAVELEVLPLLDEVDEVWEED